MRKVLTSVLVLVLSFPYAPNTSHAANKAGGLCKKANATLRIKTTNYKCVQVGNKLVWKLASSKTATKVPPITTPPITPPVLPKVKVGDKCAEYLAVVESENLVCARSNVDWALSWRLHAKPLSTKAFIAFQSVSDEVSKIKPGSSKLTFYVSPTFGIRSENLKASVQRANWFWNPIFEDPQELPILFLTEKDRQWYEETLTKLGAPQASIKELLDVFDKRVARTGAQTQHAMAGIEGFRLNYYLLGSASDSDASVGWVQVPGHEWTHNVQEALGKRLPCWFKEGHASYYGMALGARSDVEFRDLRREANSETGGVDIAKIPTGGWGNWLDGRAFDFAPYSCGPDGTYVVGFLAVEYLLSLKGHSGVVEYIRRTRTEPWDQALKTVFGLTWPDLKIQIDLYLEEVAKDFSTS